MTVIVSIKNNERGTVIRDNSDNRNKSDRDKRNNESKERMTGGGVTLPNTLTHSLNPSQTPSLTIINFHIHHIYNLGIQNYSLDCDDR